MLIQCLFVITNANSMCSIALFMNYSSPEEDAYVDEERTTENESEQHTSAHDSSATNADRSVTSCTGGKTLDSDAISYVSDSLTPTPTPNSTNQHEAKFTEFPLLSSASSSLSTPTATLPPPNTLALQSNLNLEASISPETETQTTVTTEYAAHPPLNRPLHSNISADSPEFIPSGLITYPAPLLASQVIYETRYFDIDSP